MKLIFNSPVNSLSLGIVGYELLREFRRRNMEVGWFPVGKTDLSAFKADKDFHQWLQESINNRWHFLDKDAITISNWHISGSENLRTNNQILLTYHETSAPSLIETKIVKLQKKTLFCGPYSEGVFRAAGCGNVGSFNLGFSPEYHATGKKYLDTTHWGLCQKFEHRKLTAKIISLWVQKYGNNRNHSLTLLVNNPFFSTEDNQRLIHQALGGQRFFNVNILPRLSTHSELNDYHNSIDVDLGGISPSESFNIPPFTSTALGKWAVTTESAGNLAWANEDNSIMIKPSGMRPSHDGVFFQNGGEFNQGDFFDVSDEEILKGFEAAEKKAKIPNPYGQKLQTTHSWGKAADGILAHI